MNEPLGWRQRLHQRTHGQRIARWRSGELDDAGFERAQRAWARKTALVVFGPLFLAIVGIDALMADRPKSEQLQHSLLLLGFSALFILIIALRMDRLARLGARNLLIQQTRDRAERRAPR
jgi:thiol:disulfide interchange protein